MFGQWMGDNKIVLELGNKEAIERLNNFKTIRTLYGNTFAMHLEQLKQLQSDIETVLNLIQTQQAEIEDCKKCILRDEVHNYIEELEKKDKIIDLMAKDIKEADKFLDSMGYLGEYAGYTIEDIIEEYKKEVEK